MQKQKVLQLILDKENRKFLDYDKLLGDGDRDREVITCRRHWDRGEGGLKNLIIKFKKLEKA